MGCPSVLFTSTKTRFLLRCWAMFFLYKNMYGQFDSTYISETIRNFAARIAQHIGGGRGGICPYWFQYQVIVGFGSTAVKLSTVFAAKTLLFCAFLANPILNLWKYICIHQLNLNLNSANSSITLNILC